MDKNTLRKQAKEIRKTLDTEKISADLASQIRQSKIFENSKNVMLFYPTKYEVNLLSLIEENKNFYLPRVNDKKLEVCMYKKGDRLKKSSLGIYEPINQTVAPEILDLIIVPALICDKKKYRLGYGGGYYDRFLKKVKCNTICAIPKELYIEELPIDEYDIKMDKIFLSQ